MSERILIAGAGPAGAATALAMLRAGLKPAISACSMPWRARKINCAARFRILALNAGSAASSNHSVCGRRWRLKRIPCARLRSPILLWTPISVR